MAMITDTRSVHAADHGLLSRIFSNIVARYTQYAAYRKCVEELSSLTDRELRDLDMSRSMIRSIAHETAYRNY